MAHGLQLAHGRGCRGHEERVVFVHVLVGVCLRSTKMRPNYTERDKHLTEVYLGTISARDRGKTPLFGVLSDLGNFTDQHFTPYTVVTNLMLV